MALWFKISGPVQGIVYHGWGLLVDTGETKGYCLTHSQTPNVMAEPTRRVV